MHCSKCGKELVPGQVYCPVCGQEVQIVPDYDPLDEVLWDTPEKKEQSNTDKDSTKKRKKKKGLKRLLRDPVFLKIVLTCAGILICFIVLIGSYLFVRVKNDYNHYLKKGNECFEKEEWEQALSFYRDSWELQKQEGKDDYRPLLYVARTYREMGEKQMAAETMAGVMKYQLTQEELPVLYDEYFQILNEAGKSVQINELIDSCGDSRLEKQLEVYRIERPEVNILGGEYHYYVYPKLSAAYGTIHYTLDGSTPNADSPVYKDKITLKEGDNLLMAVAINGKGIISDPLFVAYTLDFDVEDVPENKNDTIKY